MAIPSVALIPVVSCAVYWVDGASRAAGVRAAVRVVAS